MSTDVRHARPGILARLARRAPAARRQRDPFDAAPPALAGQNAHGWPLVHDAIGVRPATAGEMAAPQGETATVRAQDAPWGAWDYPGSFPDALRGTPGRYGHGLTAPDSPPVHNRPYTAPAPPARRHSPDVAADLASLPVFREAVTRRVRDHAGECLCGSPVTGQAWGERMVHAGMHLTGNEAA